MRKQLQTEYGPVEIGTPRDRDGSFAPETVKKRQTILAEGLSDKIISLYASGRACSRSVTSLRRTMAAGSQRRLSATSPIRCGMKLRPGVTVPSTRCIPSSGWMLSIIKYATTRVLLSRALSIMSLVSLKVVARIYLACMYLIVRVLTSGLVS